MLGENLVSPLRIGRDGRLYQLRTDIKTGATIAAYSLGSHQNETELGPTRGRNRVSLERDSVPRPGGATAVYVTWKTKSYCVPFLLW